jgi:hypothetical protein
MVILVDIWAESPHFWTMYPQHDSTWFEDIALDDDWPPLGELTSLIFKLDDEIYTLDVDC